MTFDQTAHYDESDAESQQGEGGTNHTFNCVPTSGCSIYHAPRYPDVEPQQITDAEYGPGHVGGESFDALIHYTHTHVDPNLQITVQSGDVVSILDTFGPQGFPMIFLGHCDAAGNYTTKLTGWEHASVVLRRSGNHTVLMNSEHNLEVGYDDATLRGIYGGCVAVFHKALPANPSPIGADMTPQQLDALLILIEHLGLYDANFERWPESDAALESNASAMAAAIMAGDRGQVEGILQNTKELHDALTRRQSVFTRLDALDARPPGSVGGVTMEQVKAEIAKAFQAGAAGA